MDNWVKVSLKLLVLLGFFLVRSGSEIPIKVIPERTTGELVATESWMISDSCGDQQLVYVRRATGKHTAEFIKLLVERCQNTQCSAVCRVLCSDRQVRLSMLTPSIAESNYNEHQNAPDNRTMIKAWSDELHFLLHHVD